MLLEGVSLDAIESEGIVDLQRRGQTISYLSSGGQLKAYFVIADPIKPTSKSALSALQHAGIEVIMASGDSYYATESVAEDLGLKAFRAPCKP